MAKIILLLQFSEILYGDRTYSMCVDGVVLLVP
jgi:hypothetical protein